MDPDWWEVARWSIATCVVRIGQLGSALEGRAGASGGLRAALEMVWQRLTAASGQGVA
jgi:hypothetical protein